MDLKNEANISVCEDNLNISSSSNYSDLYSFSQFGSNSQVELLKSDYLCLYKNYLTKEPPPFQINFTPNVNLKILTLIKNHFQIIFKIVYPEEFFQNIIEKKYYSIIGLSKVNGELICFSHIGIHKKQKKATILAMGVVKEFQNKKIGSRLLAKVLEELTILGVEEVNLIVQESNVCAIKLYNNFEFVLDTIIDDYYKFSNASENRAYLMTKKLSLKAKLIRDSLKKINHCF